jgi:hypothetical protein
VGGFVFLVGSVVVALSFSVFFSCGFNVGGVV